MKEDETKTTIYILEGLGCAHCAAKMEELIRNLPGVEEAVLTFATKQLMVTAEHPETLKERIQNACDSVEEGVTVCLKEEGGRDKGSKSRFIRESQKDLVLVAAGTILFLMGILITGWNPGTELSFFIFIAAYLVLGIRIVAAALKNLVKGHVFDENFLMSVATIGAFAIGDYKEAVGVMLFYRVGELFEEMAVNKSRTQIMEAVDLRPEVVRQIRGEKIVEIPAADAKPGDRIQIRPGDRIPLDGRIVEGNGRIDTSPITGEPVPVMVAEGSKVFSGCVNDRSVLILEVEKCLEDSMVSRILDSVEHAAASKPKIDRFITKFAKIYTPIVVSAALLTAILPSLLTGEWNYWIYTAITFLVISCPCALVLSVPLAFFSGIGAASRKGILFKGGLAIEALKRVKAVAMDKTGTITCGTFEVRQVVSTGRMTEKQILSLAADCESGSTHPIAVSIVAEAAKRGLRQIHPRHVEELPGKGIRAEYPEGIILCGSREFLEDEGVNTDRFVTAVRGTEVLVAASGQLEGYLVISDVIKSGAKASIQRLRNMKMSAAILTGDKEESAGSIAREAGIDEVYARLLPQEKLEYLQRLRSRYGPVLYVGDGINDAPVLAGADVGAAMGSGADAAIEVADVVFLTSSVEAIPDSIVIARKTGRIAMQNVVFALAIKVLVIFIGLLGFANMWMAVFADTGVAVICVLNSIRLLYTKDSLRKY